MESFGLGCVGGCWSRGRGRVKVHHLDASFAELKETTSKEGREAEFCSGWDTSKLVTDDEGDGGSSLAHAVRRVSRQPSKRRGHVRGAVTTLLAFTRGPALLLVDTEWFRVEVERTDGGETLFGGSSEPDGPAIHNEVAARSRSATTMMRAEGRGR